VSGHTGGLGPEASLLVRLQNHHPRAGGPRLAPPCTLIAFRERGTVTAQVVTAREDSRYRRALKMSDGGVGVAAPMMMRGLSDPVPTRGDGSGAAERDVSNLTQNPAAGLAAIHHPPGWPQE
jgi:hypothetical protein